MRNMKDEHKHTACPFWLQHNYDAARFKGKFEYKVISDTAYETEFVCVNDWAKKAWQIVAFIIEPNKMSDGKYDLISLAVCRLSLFSASNLSIGSFTISILYFSPSSRVLCS